MDNLMNMIWVELRKTLRSKIPFFSLLGSLFLPLGIGCLILIARNPEISRKLGLIGAKADLMRFTTADWSSYLVLVSQMVAMAGFFFFCLIISWIFGREFMDGTVKDMLAVPVHRASILLAKFIVSAFWAIVLSVAMVFFVLIMGGLATLPGGSTSVIVQGAGMALITAIMTISVVFPFALLASIGRGYLLPIGTTVITMIAANMLLIAGWAEYFPWAIPGLYSQAMSSQSSPLPAVSYWIVAITGLVGIEVTYLWWKYADQSR